MDAPDLAEKMNEEAEGIFLWAFEGLQRLAGNNFKFSESQRTRENRETVKWDNNVFDFLESEGYVRLKADMSISSKELYAIYRMWFFRQPYRKPGVAKQTMKWITVQMKTDSAATDEWSPQSFSCR